MKTSIMRSGLVLIAMAALAAAWLLGAQTSVTEGRGALAAPATGPFSLQQEGQPADPLAPDSVLQATGKLTFLRVHDVGTGYGGGATNPINTEVIIKLDTKPGQAFGFQLRDDSNRPVRQGMLDLLRDAFNNNYTVTINYDINSGEQNGIIFRVWLTK